MKIYMARKGDNLRSLAEKFHVHPDVLYEANPHIMNLEQLDAGVKVRVPIPPAALEMHAPESMYQHRVKQGDTLWKLSKAWDMPLKELVSLNQHLRNPNVLLEGEIVYIPRMDTGMSVKQKKGTATLSDAGAFPNQSFPDQSFPNQSFPIHSDMPEIVNPSPFAGTPEAEQMYWGELYPTYTTSAMYPYDSYTIDPRQNIPAYPIYDGINEGESDDQQPVNIPKSRNKQVKRTKSKNRKSIKVPSKRKAVKTRSGNKRRASRPWTTI